VEGVRLEEGGWVHPSTPYFDHQSAEQLLRKDGQPNLSDELLTRSEELSQTNRALMPDVIPPSKSQAQSDLRRKI